MEIFLSQFNYIASFLLFVFGLFLMITSGNLIKMLYGLAIFQISILLFFISMAVVKDGTAPIIQVGEEVIYVNPLPHVLVLTAIVVGLATLSVGLALTIRIKKAFGSIEEDGLMKEGEL